MKKRSLQGRIIAFILTICVAAALTPISAFSEGVNYISNINVTYEHIEYKAGDAPRTAAAVSNADAHCTVAYEYWREIHQVEEGGVWSGTGRCWYSDPDKMAALSPDKRITKFEAGKHYSYNIVLAADRGYFISGDETSVSVGGYDWGTPDRSTNLEIKELSTKLFIYSPYAIDIPNESSEKQAITKADIENVKLDHKDGDTPQAAAKAAAGDADKYDVLYECWEMLGQIDEYTTGAVAYWYSDDDRYQPDDVRFDTFDKNEKYQYSVRLKAKDGFTFSNSISVENITLNGKKLPAGSYVVVLDEGKTCIIVYGTSIRTIRSVGSVELNGPMTESFIDGDEPKFAGGCNTAFYDIDHQSWEDSDNSGVGIASSEEWNKDYDKLITAFEYGKTYNYGVYFSITDIGLEEGCRFDENTKLYINGEEINLNSDQVKIYNGGELIQFKNVLSMTPEAAWQEIDMIEIEGASIDFKAGDKPVFTGKVSEDTPYIIRQCEWWNAEDGSGVNSAEFWDKNYEKHITAFESGMTYTYGVYVKAQHGYCFTSKTKLKINGKVYDYHLREGDPELENPDRMSTLWAVTDLTLTPKAADTSSDSGDTNTDSKDTSSNNSSTNSNSSKNNDNKTPAKNDTENANPKTGDDFGGILSSILIIGSGLIVAGIKSRKNKG